jgi:hypothetical protein
VCHLCTPSKGLVTFDLSVLSYTFHPIMYLLLIVCNPPIFLSVLQQGHKYINNSILIMLNM